MLTLHWQGLLQRCFCFLVTQNSEKGTKMIESLQVRLAIQVTAKNSGTHRRTYLIVLQGSRGAYFRTFELRVEGCLVDTLGHARQKHVQKLEGKMETLKKFKVVFMHGVQDGK